MGGKDSRMRLAVVAFSPTKAPVGVPALLWWTPTAGVLHHVAAIVLFAMFAIFALWLFRLTADGEQPVADKRRRNKLYLYGRPIFWPESIALIAFSLSWLVKGYALRTIVGTGRQYDGTQLRSIISGAMML